MVNSGWVLRRRTVDASFPKLPQRTDECKKALKKAETQCKLQASIAKAAKAKVQLKCGNALKQAKRRAAKFKETQAKAEPLLKEKDGIVAAAKAAVEELKKNPSEGAPKKASEKIQACINLVKESGSTTTRSKVKARLVATQVNYGSVMDTFAATPTSVAIKMLFQRALKRGWRVFVGDVSTAFLHASLPPEDLVYVRPPPTEKSATGIPFAKLLWRLRKAL